MGTTYQHNDKVSKEDLIFEAETADRAVILNSSKEVESSVTTSTELSYVSGVTSSIQTQIDSKLNKALTDTYIFVGDGSNEAIGVDMTGDIGITNAGVTSISSGVIVNDDVNASAAIELSKLEALTANRALASDGSGEIIVSAVTDTELGYLDGVSSNVQDQLDAKINDSILTARGDIIVADATPDASNLALGSSNQILTSDGTDPVWRSNVILNDETASRAIILNGSKQLTSSSVTDTELGYVSGVTSAIQTQINGKQDDVITNQGDLIIGDGSGNASRLAIGTNGYFLRSNGTTASWAAGGGGGGSTTLLSERTVGSVGSSGQVQAGHTFSNDEGGAGTDLAYYKFLSTAMTTDEQGTYTLTDPGGANSPSNANGIFGSDLAASFGGNDYYTQATLLDSPSSLSNGIAIDFWFKADDGKPSAQEVLWCKVNNESSLARIGFTILTNGSMALFTAVSGTTNTLTLGTTLPDGTTDFYHITVNWDTTNGQRVWVNGVLDSIDTSKTTLLGDGTTRDFIIGAFNQGGSIANQFNGDIALFRIRDMVLTQKDVDLTYSVKVDITGGSFANTDFEHWGILNEGGTDTFYKRVIPGEVHRTTSDVYLYGNQYNSSDKIKLLGRS